MTVQLFVAPLIAASFLVTAAVPSPATARSEAPPAGRATIEATVTVAPVVLPDKKSGERHLRFALGKDAEAAAREVIVEGLTRYRSFAEVVESGGDVTLQVTITRAEQHFADLLSHGASKSPLTTRLEGTARWTKGEAVHEGALVSSNVKHLDRPPHRRDLAAAWNEVLLDTARNAFSEALQSGSFGVTGANTSWIDDGKPK